MDGYFRARYSLPLSAWGADVTRINAVLAVYDLLVTRGYNPAAGADVNVRLRTEDAINWLKGVSRQEIHPDVTPQQHESAGFNAPDVVTHESRGY
jgi:phage gp36-like protein